MYSLFVLRNSAFFIRIFALSARFATGISSSSLFSSSILVLSTTGFFAHMIVLSHSVMVTGVSVTGGGVGVSIFGAI